MTTPERDDEPRLLGWERLAIALMLAAVILGNCAAYLRFGAIGVLTLSAAACFLGAVLLISAGGEDSGP